MAPTRRSKRTLRRLTPIAKKIAKLGNELQSAKLIALSEEVAAVEHKAIALDNFMATQKQDDSTGD